MIFNVIPINDTNTHTECSTCECLPDIIIVENGNIVIQHNSFDGREGVELANEVLES